MTPATGERLLRFVGDRVRFTLRAANGTPPGEDWRAFLRTNLGRARALRQEIITSRGGEKPLTGASWRDIPLRRAGDEWVIELALTEVGYFKAKAYAVDEKGWQVWPAGGDVGLSVHPDRGRTSNTIYCAFTRLFGETKTAISTAGKQLEAQLKSLDKQGYTVLPASGKLRDLARELPHIIGTLGCRIVHLLPINPTPTTCARFGRYGSPYAGLDLTAIDPALVEFDRRTTALDQFHELAYAVHERGARLFLDLVVNHTGWSSTLHEQHPEWFLRGPDGAFVSPGAWGVTWEDLVELNPGFRDLWDHLADAFLTWCRRGVDGFRCDAGYKVPMPVWQHITARVREEFPEAVFLLEGLGGGWSDTETLLTEGGMQWAYSELFQEFSGVQVAGYLDHALKQSQRVGVLVHYSETHDNNRLAAKGRAWSLLRNRLSALAGISGAYGFTCGVEWLATEKILVHGCAGLSWGAAENIVAELAQLNKLLAEHPCFFDGAKLTRLSPAESPVFALRRDSSDGSDSLLVLANTDIEKAQALLLEDPAKLPSFVTRHSEAPLIDLLGQAPPAAKRISGGKFSVTLEPGACHCLAPTAAPRGLSGEAYRQARARAAWAIAALREVLEPEEIGPHDWRALADRVTRNPGAFLASLGDLDRQRARDGLLAALQNAAADGKYERVLTWSLIDHRRVTLVPPGHWLLIRDNASFHATLRAESDTPRHVESVSVNDGHVACFAPRHGPADADLVLERYAAGERHIAARLRFLPSETGRAASRIANRESPITNRLSSIVLLTNGIGGMARMCVDLGNVLSKYDCLLGANLHASLPVDRHVLVKRVRVWANANGFISPLNADNLTALDPGPPARWQFAANAGDGRTVAIELTAEMVPGRNTTALRFARGAPDATTRAAPAAVKLTARVDIEDRNFHWETKRNADTERHFAAHVRTLPDQAGFAFVPSEDRPLRAFIDAGTYHAEPEWCENIPHPVEASRGQTACGDAYSPGWFDLPLPAVGTVTLVVSAEKDPPGTGGNPEAGTRNAESGERDSPGSRLRGAIRAFIVRRGDARTVIAGYPWFLDWGRDTLICARGLLAAGYSDIVQQILVTFGRLEQSGTLPNALHGEDASNRDTADAPLWFGLACEETAAIAGERFYSTIAGPRGRTIADVLSSIVTHYWRGTPNGIRMDPASALIWSPSHFTWMDTNHPAGTPREGYPIEIQALWIRLLRQLDRIGAAPQGEPWNQMADRAETSLHRLYWLEDRAYFADCLIAKPGEPANPATTDTSLRCNYLFPLSLGLVTGEKARRSVEAARRYLVVPGALRSLAPLPVSPPLPIAGPDGRPLNNPDEPYQGRYEGDEDTQRKPAYHNGTAWVWMLPNFCEALARAWNFAPAAVAAAKAYLASVRPLFDEGCLGQLPEIVDGDAPHAQRGCDAQAWSATEALRVWTVLDRHEGEETGDRS